MATYVYRCTECATFESSRPMREVTSTAACPRCGRAAIRVFTPPHLNTVSTVLRTAADVAEASAERPVVTQQVPGARATRPSRTASGTPTPLHPSGSTTPAHPPLPRS